MSHRCTLDGTCESAPPLPIGAAPIRVTLPKVTIPDDDGTTALVIPDIALIRASRLRNPDCASYDRCLDYTACRDWDAWDCTACPVYTPVPLEDVQPRERCVSHHYIHSVVR